MYVVGALAPYPQRGREPLRGNLGLPLAGTEKTSLTLCGLCDLCGKFFYYFLNYMTDINDLSKRHIRSFVLRQGRVSTAQQRCLDTLMPRYGIPYAAQALDLDAAFGRAAPRILEIGFGRTCRP